MTETEFRKLALALPETIEASHMDHPDFRVGGKIFAALDAPAGWGTLKLTPEQQDFFMESESDVYRPAAGAWGRRGWTQVNLKKAKKKSVIHALAFAWRNTAPKRLLRSAP